MFEKLNQNLKKISHSAMSPYETIDYFILVTKFIALKAHTKGKIGNKKKYFLGDKLNRYLRGENNLK